MPRSHNHTSLLEVYIHWMLSSSVLLHIFVLHDVIQLAGCTPSLSDSPFHFCTWSCSLIIICSRYTYLSTSSIFFPTTITSFLLACLLHITLVFARCILRSLACWCHGYLGAYSVVLRWLAMRTISSEKVRWDKHSPSIQMPLFSQLILLMTGIFHRTVKWHV